MSIHVAAWQATIVTAIILLLLLKRWGDKLPKKFHFDEWIGAVVIVFGIAGPLYRTPRFGQLAHWMQDTITGAANDANADWRAPVFLLVSASILVAVFMWYRKSNGGLWAAIALILSALPLFTNKGMRDVDEWYVDHVGAALFRLLIKAINWAAGGPV